MKKGLSMIIIGCIALTLMPINVNAETLQDYIDKVNNYTSELQSKQNQIATNDAEIKKIQEEIAKIKTQMENIKVEQAKLQEEIKANNQKIADKKEETKSLVKYAQVSQGDNFYLDYIFGADSLTDMVYRMALVEQITKYNDKVVDELNNLIEDNKTKKKELAEKDEELKKLEKELDQKQKKLTEDNAAIREGMPSVQEQINQAQKMVDLYKNKGCNPSDVIGVDCAVIPKVPSRPSGGNGAGDIASTGSFIRPYENGYVTSSFGGRSFDDFHYGIDLGTNTNRYNTKIYPIAPGIIYNVGYDIYGAKIVRIAHNYNGRIVGSTYVHLKSFAPGIYEGMEVGTDDYIGIMGETGLAYGIHLHLEVSDCPYLYAGSSCYGWNSYITYLRNNWQDPAEYINFPSEWSLR